MTTPDVPLRMELTFEVPGTPEQVWDAIATAGGITSWFLPTDLEERVGGAIVTHMGEGASSEGTVTAWDPPRRLAYEEPDWAALAGHDPTRRSPRSPPSSWSRPVRAAPASSASSAAPSAPAPTGSASSSTRWSRRGRRSSSTCACTSPTSPASGPRR